MNVTISDLTDGGRVIEFEGKRSLSIVFTPERILTYFVLESDYKPSKTGVIPSMESLTELLLWVQGYIDIFPEDKLYIEE